MKRLLSGLLQLVLVIAPALVLFWLWFSQQRTGALAHFALQLAVLGVPLAVLAWFHQIYAARSFVIAAALPALLSLGLLAGTHWLMVVWMADAVVAGVAAIELLTLPRKGQVSVERTTGRIASLRKRHPVSLEVANRAARPIELSVRDGVPEGIAARPEILEHRLAGRSRVRFHYELVPRRRGAFTLPAVYVRVHSRLGFWQRYLSYPQQTTIHVYPDLQQLSQYAVLARVDRLNLLGMRRVRRLGEDNEFERLRDYTTGDNYKHIAWRTTARRRKLTVKEYQQNQSQRLMLLLDCGRMMTNEVAGLSLLDYALNASLMLSYVALSRGDAVGMIAFSDEVHGYVPPRSGLKQMNRLLHASFDQFPRLVESRYDRAFLHLETRSRKRSLVVLITNLIDEVNRNRIEGYLGNLAGRHLPLGALLRDRRIFDFANASGDDSTTFYRKAAAADLLAWRQQLLADLHTKGVLSVDVFPEDLTAPLVNRYLDIKARHLL